VDPSGTPRPSALPDPLFRLVCRLGGGLPAAGVAAGFLLARLSGDLGPVAPPFDGEVSISRAMRHEPAVQVFRALTMPGAAFMALAWWGVGERLGGRASARWATLLGVLGAVFLVLYASYLGSDGDVYRLLRRYGVYVFFGGTGLGLTVAAWSWPAVVGARSMRTLRWLTALMLAAGPAQMVVDRVVADDDVVANVLEWWIAGGLMFGLALLAGLAPRGGST